MNHLCRLRGEVRAEQEKSILNRPDVQKDAGTQNQFAVLC
jgi:hypothetical protein